MQMQGHRSDFESGGARFSELTRVGDELGILLINMDFSIILKTFDCEHMDTALLWYLML